MTHFRDVIYHGIIGLNNLPDDCPLKQNLGDYPYACWVLSMRDIPAALAIEIDDYINPDKFTLYCQYNGVKHKVIRGSNVGDIFITSDLNSDGYDKRVPIEQLEQFSKD